MLRTFASVPRAPRRSVPVKPAPIGLPILRLQGAVGNQAVVRQLQSQSDARERDADRLADRAMTRVGPAGSKGLDRRTHRAHTAEPLSAEERAFFEPRFGHDFTDVQIHADERSAAMAHALDAEAFTIGRSIYFGAGRVGSRTAGSDQLLAHELAHVVQQSSSGPAVQPKLKFTGQAAHVARAIALLNSGVSGFYYVSLDSSGEVHLDPIRAAFTSSITGPDARQKALADHLWTVINDANFVNMTVSSGSLTWGGSYATGDFDIADLEVYGVAGLIHEIVEQYLKQVKGMAYGSETTGAHAAAMTAESAVRGAVRGPNRLISQTAYPDGTRDAVIENDYTFPDGSMKTMVRTIKRNNFVSMTWR